MELFDWIEEKWKPKLVHSVDFMYDEMESQSAHCLPVIYQPFDAAKRSHWRDRGSLFDFLYTTRCEGKRILDFGPGDGWPSLIIAPYVREVIGVDGSQKRVSVCSKNGKRMGIKNVKFLHVVPGKALPFDNDTFDAIVAASAVEQTPEPQHTIKEFYRVLKPGGRLRIDYEGLASYKDGKERELFFDSQKDGNCVLTIYDRHIEEERVDMYKIKCIIRCRQIIPGFLESEKRIEDISFEMMSIQILEGLMPCISDVKKCTLTHPSGGTFCSWMRNIGFREVHPSQSGVKVAGKLFDTTAEQKRPKTMSGVDELLKPAVKAISETEVALTNDPPITAVK